MKKEKIKQVVWFVLSVGGLVAIDQLVKLSIVRQIIMLHKGTISVESQLGEGTSFTVKLPLLQTVEQEDEE